MNKKFIKVSTIVSIPIILLIGFSVFYVKDINDYSYDEFEERLKIEFKNYKEDKYSHILTIKITNNSKDIANLYDMDLSFDYTEKFMEEFGGISPSDVRIVCREEDRFEEGYNKGIDPGKSKDIVFKIPKGLSLDEKIFDTKHPIINYNVSFYKFRTSSNSFMIGSGSEGGSKTLFLEEY